MDVSFHDVKVCMKLILDSHKCIVTDIKEYRGGKAGSPKKVVFGKDIDTGEEYQDVLLKGGGFVGPRTLSSFQ